MKSGFFSIKINWPVLAVFITSLVLTFILFGPTLKGDYVLDDHSVVEQRQELKSLKNLKEIFFMPWHPAAPWAGNYRPLTMLSFAVNYLFSEKPVWFHLVNIVFHALNVTLIYFLVQHFASRQTALLSAVFFMFLPIHVEPVASIVGRSDLMGTFFILLSLFWFFKKKYWWSSLAFLLALLVKDFSIALLPIIGALLFVETRSFWASFKTGLYYLVPLLFYFICRYLALGKYAFGGYGYIDPVIGPLAFVPFSQRVFTGLVHFFLYLRKSFLPFDLSPDYSFNQIPIVSNFFSSFQAILGFLLLIGLVVLFFYTNRQIKVALVLLLIPFAVMSNIFFITTGTFAERWWYFPSFGLVTLTAVGLDKFLGRIKVNFNPKSWPKAALVYGTMAIVLIWYGLIIFRTNKAWLDDRALYFYSVEKSPNSVGARTNAAAIYVKEKQFDKAKEQIKAAMKIYDKNPATLSILGKLYWRDGKYIEAKEIFLRGLESDSRRRNARNFYRLLAFLKLDEGENYQALEFMRKAVNEPPGQVKENVVQTDLVLYQVINKFKDKTLSTYTKEERGSLIAFIKLVRGF